MVEFPPAACKALSSGTTAVRALAAGSGSSALGAHTAEIINTVIYFLASCLDSVVNSLSSESTFP